MLLTDVQRGEKLTRRQSIKLGAACFAVGAGPTLNRGSAAPPQPIPAVVVLDDCDPNYEKGKSREDEMGFGSSPATAKKSAASAD